VGRDGLRPDGGNGVVPVFDPLAVIGCRLIPGGQIKFGKDGGGVGDDCGADLVAQLGQIGLVRALAWDQDQIGGVQRLDRLQGQMIGVAGANADKTKFKHARPLLEAGT